MQKIKFFSFFLLLYSLLFLEGCSAEKTVETTAEAAEDSKAAENENILSLGNPEDISQVYTLEYQDQIEEEIQNLWESSDYTLENPLVLADPYGTNTTALYIRFRTDTPVKISYTVSAPDYEDFSEDLSEDYSQEHEYLLIGILPDTLNTITLKATDQNGNSAGTTQLEYQAPSLAGSSENIQLDVTSGESQEEPSIGLYTMLGNRTEEDNSQTDFILLYDNAGTLRSEIPIKSYRACNMLFDDANVFFSISADEEEALDWIHINSIRLLDKDSIIINSRETSTIIKIDDIYDNPSVDYLIGSEQFWEESGYEDLVLAQDGEFALQHTGLRLFTGRKLYRDLQRHRRGGILLCQVPCK